MASGAMALQQTKRNYPAVEAILSCLYEGSIVPMDTALRIESKYITKLLMGATSKNTRPQYGRSAKGYRLFAENPRQKSLSRTYDERESRGFPKTSSRPEQYIGMHFFSPVDKMPLLEIIPHKGTGDLALAAALDYNKKIRKTPIIVKDVRGFFTNQVFPPYINEAALMVTEGVSMALIENCAANLGLPIGPLAVSDL